jgi:hypothetical protein
MAKREKGQTMIYKKLHRRLYKDKETWSSLKSGVNSYALEE